MNTNEDLVADYINKLSLKLPYNEDFDTEKIIKGLVVKSNKKGNILLLVNEISEKLSQLKYIDETDMVSEVTFHNFNSIQRWTRTVIKIIMEDDDTRQMYTQVLLDQDEDVKLLEQDVDMKRLEQDKDVKCLEQTPAHWAMAKTTVKKPPRQTHTNIYYNPLWN